MSYEIILSVFARYFIKQNKSVFGFAFRKQSECVANGFFTFVVRHGIYLSESYSGAPFRRFFFFVVGFVVKIEKLLHKLAELYNVVVFSLKPCCENISDAFCVAPESEIFSSFFAPVDNKSEISFYIAGIIIVIDKQRLAVLVFDAEKLRKIIIHVEGILIIFCFAEFSAAHHI